MGDPRGYTEVKTPQLYDASLWKVSWALGQVSTGTTCSSRRGRTTVRWGSSRVMNCAPGLLRALRQSKWSYKSSPCASASRSPAPQRALRALHGLMRVRHFFCQDDAHLFVTEDQLQEELTGCIEFAKATYDLFGFTDADIKYELSTRRESPRQPMSSGISPRASCARRSRRTARLRDRRGRRAFYGPQDRLSTSPTRSSAAAARHRADRLPGPGERFDLTYNGRRQRRPPPDRAAPRADGQLRALHRHPARAHRWRPAPLWLAPVQARILPIADRHNDAARAPGRAGRRAWRARLGR